MSDEFWVFLLSETYLFINGLLSHLCTIVSLYFFIFHISQFALYNICSFICAFFCNSMYILPLTLYDALICITFFMSQDFFHSNKKLISLSLCEHPAN